MLQKLFGALEARQALNKYNRETLQYALRGLVDRVARFSSQDVAAVIKARSCAGRAARRLSMPARATPRDPTFLRFWRLSFAKRLAPSMLLSLSIARKMQRAFATEVILQKCNRVRHASSACTG